jgi:hypothetical protein
MGALLELSNIVRSLKIRALIESEGLYFINVPVRE